MLTLPARRGRVAVIGGGPAGMATALSVRQAGHDVAVFERYHEARPAGSLLNLWPPPIKALRAMSVDTTDFGAPCRTEFQVQLAWMNGKLFHHTPRLLQPVRDFVLDHTPLLQKVVGDASPGEINKQLALIED